MLVMFNTLLCPLNYCLRFGLILQCINNYFFFSFLCRKYKCWNIHIYAFLFGFVLPLPAHLLQLPQQATPRSVAFTSLSVLWCVLLRELVTVICACSGYVNRVFVCKCFTLRLIVVGQYRCVYVCVCLLVHLSSKRVHLHSYIQSWCWPVHGLQSKKKAQERHAAGVQFGAVSCWMLCHKQKKDSVGVLLQARYTFTAEKHDFFLKCLQ